MSSPINYNRVFTSRGSAGFFLALMLLLAACGGPTATPAPTHTTVPTETSGAPGLCANPYFPVVEGATWTYLATGTGEDYTWTATVSEVSETGFALRTQFDELVTTQQWACTPEGLAALQYGGGPEAVITASGLLGVFETSDASGVSFPAQIQVGDTWQQSFSMQGQMVIREGVTADANGTISQTYVAAGLETVTVPAGSFEAMKVDTNIVFDLQLSLGGIGLPMVFDAVTTNWWAPGIGWVKSDATADMEGGDSFMWLIELQSFSIP